MEEKNNLNKLLKESFPRVYECNKSIRNHINLLLEENKEKMIAIMDRIPIDDDFRRNCIIFLIRSNNKAIEELVFSKQAIDERKTGYAKTLREKELKRYEIQKNSEKNG